MRLFDIIKSELYSDKLKLEEEIERVINDKTLNTDDKVSTIKKLLIEVGQIELGFKKFEGYITTEDNAKITKNKK